MRILKFPLIILVVLIVVVPMALNSYNINVNKQTIDCYKSAFHLARFGRSQVRIKSVFFPDGKFEGFRIVPTRIMEGVYCQTGLECNYRPERTLFRIKLFRKSKEGFSLIGNVSFAGEFKYEMMREGFSSKRLKRFIGIYAEKITGRKELNGIIKDKKQ